MNFALNPSATKDLSIGTGKQELTYSRNGLVTGYDISSYFVVIDVTDTTGTKMINLGSSSIAVRNGVDTEARGYTYSISGTNHVLVDPTGRIFTFGHHSGTPDMNDQIVYLTSIKDPDGSVTRINWKQFEYPSWNGETTTYEFFNRIQSVDNNYGYLLKFDYKSDLEPYSAPNPADWETLTTITGVNLAVQYCDRMADSCALDASWPKVSYTRPTPNSLVVQDAIGAQRTYSSSGVTGSASEEVSITGVGSTRTVMRQGVSINYSRAANTVTRTEPGSITTNFTLGPANAYNNSYTRIESIRSPLNKTTSFLYDGFGRVTSKQNPEGDSVKYIYDNRGNVTEERYVSKTPGTPPDVVLTAGYDINCTIPVKCNKPNWTRDAQGNQTDYTYDNVHGQILEVRYPPDPQGIRPTTAYTYSDLQASFFNSSGSIAPSGQPVALLTNISSCLSDSVCAGTANESRLSTKYGAQDGATPNNLSPKTIVRSNGDSTISAETSFTYDPIGNITAIDGPLDGTSDRTLIRYDAVRRNIGVISPDPDGTSPLPNIATRVTYDARGRMTSVEQGTTSGQTDAAWVAFTPAQTSLASYNNNDQKVMESIIGSNVTYVRKQFSYDSNGRLDCSVLRMNPSVYGSLPTDACAPSVAGVHGPDRITKYAYNKAHQITSIQKGYGTSYAALEATEYTDNGNVRYIIDGKGNKTTIEYDGHDRLYRLFFPVTTPGSNASSTTDYIQYGYDNYGAFNNIRLRDGTSISYSYDKLGRLATQASGGQILASYGYDLHGHPTSVGNGVTIVNTWDALGRLTKELQPYGSLSYGYDAANRLTRISWDDGFYAGYEYDALGRVTKIKENGATSGTGALGVYSYDPLGRRAVVTFGNGTSRSYAYDQIGRLSGLKIDLPGTANDQLIGAVGGVGVPIGYNPAAQIVSIVRSNSIYSWSSYFNVDRSYIANGLNQYQAAGSTYFSYDASGNLTKSGSSSYGYNKFNQLTTAPGSLAMSYDGAGRMVSYSNGVPIRMVYSGSGLAAEVDQSGSIARRYVPGPAKDEPLVWYEGPTLTKRRFLQSDERGSIIAVSDSVGATLAINRYDEFGIPQNTNLGRYQFTGQTWFPELGMYNYKARIYSPTLGRFLQTDPIGYGDGLNWYTYADGDPINRKDPDGLDSICASGQVLGAGSVACEDLGSSTESLLSVAGGVKSNPYGTKWYQNILWSDSWRSAWADEQDRKFAELYFRSRANPYLSKLSEPQSGPCGSHPILGAIGKVRNSPNSALGLVAAGASYLAGKWQGTNPSFQVGNNSIQLLNSPLNVNNRAYTLGNVQVYGVGNGPSRWQISYTGAFVNTGRHEEGHTVQGQILGLLYLPAWGLGRLFGGDSAGNPMEAGADNYGQGKSCSGF